MTWVDKLAAWTWAAVTIPTVAAPTPLAARRDYSSCGHTSSSYCWQRPLLLPPHTMAKPTDNLPFCMTRIFNHYWALILGPCWGGDAWIAIRGAYPPPSYPLIMSDPVQISHFFHGKSTLSQPVFIRNLENPDHV